MDPEHGQDENAPAQASDKSAHTFAAGSGDNAAVEEVALPVEVPTDASAQVWIAAIKSAEKIALRGMLFGFLVIAAGIVLILLGASGSVTLEFSSGDINSKLQTGVVGVVIALIGLGVIYFSRQKISSAASTPPKKGKG
jgi:hypothetical protein